MAKVVLLMLLFVGYSLQEEIQESVTEHLCASSNDTAQILLQLQRLQQAKCQNIAEVQSSSPCQTYEALKNLTEVEFANSKITLQQLVAEGINARSAELARAADQRRELTQALSELRMWITLELSAVRAQIKEAAGKSSFYCSQWTTNLDGSKLIKLSTGYYVYCSSIYDGFARASMWCKNHGMRLAKIESLLEMQVLAQNAPQNLYWVDASDAGFGPEDFRWSDGTKVAAELWQSGQPKSNANGREACVQLKMGPGSNKLNVATCADEYGYPLCEVDAEHLGCL